jgi:uncharacterized membrane protein YvlD (DUF360 family)
MKLLLKKYFVITLSLFLLTQIISAITIQGGWKSLFYSSFVLTILFYIARPIANLVLLPINILTLNLASWLINILIFFIWTRLTAEVKIESWQFNGLNVGLLVISPISLASWQVILIGGVVITIIVQFLDWLIK